MKKHDVRKNAYKFVGKVLRNQHGIERAVKEARMQTGGHSGGGGGGHAFVSDPTAQQAVRLATELRAVTVETDEESWTLRWPEKWLRVIKCSYDNCYPYEAKAMRYYYDGHTATRTGEQYGMDQSTVYRIRSEFLHLATELACQYGLVRVVSDEELRA